MEYHKDSDPLDLCSKILEMIRAGDLKQNVVTILATTIVSLGLKNTKPSLELTEIVS